MKFSLVDLDFGRVKDHRKIILPWSLKNQHKAASQPFLCEQEKNQACLKFWACEYKKLNEIQLS